MKWRLLVAVLVLIVGAFLPLSPVTTWASGEEPSGAPAAEPGPDRLVDARRAAGEAAAEASLLTTGTGQLVNGVDQLDQGSGQLVDGLAAANSGAQQLSQGMVQLQAGTGQLADGATQIADTIGGVVDRVLGFEVVRGQIIAALDSVLDQTKDANDPNVVRARDALNGLRDQARTAELPPDIANQLNQFKDGSREVANQLAVPGYGYHDGVYQATNGAAELAKGLKDLNQGAGAAQDGIDQLKDGSQRLDGMAASTATRIDGIRGAIPAPAPVPAGENGDDAAPASPLAPLAAVLVAALITLGGFAVAIAGALTPSRRWWIIAGGTVLVALTGLILIGVIGVSLSPLAMAISTLALALGVLASAGLTWMLMSSFGNAIGAGVAAVLSVLQIGVVAWVWRSVVGGGVNDIAAAVSSALPMHWLTASLSAAGNGGSTTALWVGVGLSAVIAALGLAGLNRPHDGGVVKQKLA